VTPIEKQLVVFRVVEVLYKGVVESIAGIDLFNPNFPAGSAMSLPISWTSDLGLPYANFHS